MRVLVRISRLAVWSARLAWFALPLLVLAVVLHRTGTIGADVFEICLAIASGLGLMAVLLGIGAWVRLWFTGDRGWSRAGLGMVLGALAAIPAIYAGVMLTLHPSTADISTDPLEPPPLMLMRETGRVTGAADLGRRFPHVATRTYQVAPEALFDLARVQLRWRGWELLAATEPSAVESGALHALRTTLFGWDNEIVLRIRPEPDGARIDMRAASLHPPLHDLGLNGRLIEMFLLSLDEQVSTFVREGLADLETVEEDDLIEMLEDEDSI